MKQMPRDKGFPSCGGSVWRWIIGAACVLGVLFAFLMRWPHEDLNGKSSSSPVSSTRAQASGPGSSTLERRSRTFHHDWPAEGASTAEEIVARKLAQFGKSRHKLVRAIAKHFTVDVPADVERFFAAVEAGNWDEIDAAHAALLEPRQGLNQPRSADLHQIWRAIQETWGIAREAHNWPAQTLLNYGDAVLGSLKPGMIYVGGTDPGCFIPTFLNETADGEQHITLTQNALADGTYLDYLNFLYGDRMQTLTHEDSERASQAYLADAQTRLQHDQQFPNEPKQLRPGEDVHMTDGRVEVSGQVAVMAINERLFQMLMDKNPDASFAMEESYPFRSVYSNAVPLGPIMELRADDSQNAWSADRAAQSVEYWSATAQQLLADPNASDNSDPRKAYSKMICAQAGLLLDHNYPSEAEQAFRMATDLCPSSPEAVFRYVSLLADQKRFADAIPVVERAVQADPENQQLHDLLNQVRSLK